MKRINLNMFPKDGYQFVEKDGVRIVGPSWKAVIVRVTDYRKRNGLLMGNVDQEVHDFACEKNPAYCSEITEQQKEMTRVASLKGRILGWLSGVVQARQKEKNALTLVPEHVAAERAEICAGCPKNIAFSDGCSSCKAAVKEYRKAVIGNRTTKGRLNGCVILGEDLPVSINLDEARVPNEELPSNCWRKTSI